VKTNLFSRFRNLFRRTEADYDYDDCYDESCEYGYDSDVVVEEPTDGEPVFEEEVPVETHSGGTLHLPAGAQPAAEEADPAGIYVPLSPIIAAMPLELQSRVLCEVGDLSVFLPLESILPQLSKGIVLLSFGELRNAAPDLFSKDRDQDDANVNIPLAAILPHISPDMLARKHGPLQMEIPDDIVSPFADKGRGLALGAVKPAAAPLPTGRPSASKPIPRPPTPSQPISQAAPAPVSIPFATPGASGRPSQAPQASRPVGNTGFRFQSQPRPSLGAETPSASPAQPGQHAPSRPAAPGARPAVGKAPVPEPGLPAQNTGSTSGAPRSPLSVALSTVADAWPDALKQELIQLSLADATLAIPYEVVEAGLKRGRLNFTWKKMKGWIAPDLATTISVHDGAELELPLRVVAPLFINQKKEQPQKAARVAVDKDIPNLFFGLPQPDTAGVAVDRSVNRPLDTNYYVWDDQSDVVPDDARNDATRHARTAGTEFVTRYATPNEVVSRAAALDGIEGAVISLPDGLMVASQLPPGLNGDTLAAFLPHIFSKVTQCTQELRMGPLNNLNFTVGNVPWKIFRVNALFFAAFGAKGKAMPTARLAELAGELDHKAKV